MKQLLVKCMLKKVDFTNNRVGLLVKCRLKRVDFTSNRET